MNISRKILRSLILNEIRSSLKNLNRLAESDLILKMISGKDPEEIADSISKIKNLDDMILAALQDEEGFKDAISELDEEKSDMLVNVLGQLRASLAPSTFNKLKELIIDGNLDLKDSLSSM
tara:strand:- start:5639 stop:6001 length:363 start_codon:yes stop_codon:yes gene_type:complete